MAKIAERCFQNVFMEVTWELMLSTIEGPIEAYDGFEKT